MRGHPTYQGYHRSVRDTYRPVRGTDGLSWTPQANQGTTDLSEAPPTCRRHNGPVRGATNHRWCPSRVIRTVREITSLSEHHRLIRVTTATGRIIGPCHRPIRTTIQGRRHEVSIGGRIQTHKSIYSKKSFSLDFGHLILKILEKAKSSIGVKEKDTDIGIQISGGTFPADLSTGGRVPPTPASDVHATMGYPRHH